MELLAPAGDLPCLEAAVAAGADAVYMGLSLLNARRGAKNFTPVQLEQAVETAHRRDIAVHLALNIDVSRRETGAAARILAMARDVGVDAVIARDWAVVGLWRAMRDAAEQDDSFCPALHLSTQTAVTNLEGAKLARDVGVSRVVLAREMSLDEIRQVTALDGIEIEVFAQGALCYSISGRCLMSSWGGGRSGNRGLCTSPCRVPWAVGGEDVGTAMSMRDLVTVDRLGELAHAGVDAIKIEGRLKKPEWVAEAVGLYREALGPRSTAQREPRPATAESISKARRLAAYAGRDVTSSYLDGSYSGLTGVAARKSARAANDAINEFLSGKPGGGMRARAVGRDKEPEERDGYELDVNVTERGLSCRCRYRGRSHSWRLPRTRIKREKKAQSLEDLFSELKKPAGGDPVLSESYTNEPDFLLPPRNVKAIVATVASFVKRLAGRDDDGSDAVMKAPLPDGMRPVLAAPSTDDANRRRLGERVSQVRVAVKQLNSGLLPILKEVSLVLVNALPADMEFALKFVDPEDLIIAFPEVYFPAESGQMVELAEFCRDRNIRAEANCWGSLWLCRRYGLRFTAGPGLAVLNHIAVKCLRDLGCAGATVSMEADKGQIEELSAASALPLTLLVYARPILAHTRIPRSDLLPDPELDPSKAWTDRRGISLNPETGCSTTFFRSLTAFDWKTLQNDAIRVAELSVDLSGESSPIEVWRKFVRSGGKPGFLFNYDRGLK